MTLANKVARNLDDTIQSIAAEQYRDYSYLHPSSMGACPRKVFYEASGVTPDMPHSPKQNRIFTNGHFLHLRYQLYMYHSGMLAADKVKDKRREDVPLGLTDVDRVIVSGETGRDHFYSPNEWVWLDREPENPVSDLGGMNPPEMKRAFELEVGDRILMVETPLHDPEYHLGGHADAIVKTDGEAAVVDFKSAAQNSFAYLFHNEKRMSQYVERYIDKHFTSCHICGTPIARWKDFVEHLVAEHLDEFTVDHKHRIQLNLYMWQLGLSKGMLIYENKDNQIVVSKEVLRDDALIYELQTKMRILWDQIVNGEVPDRPYSSRDRFPCGWCDYVSHCWS